MKQERATSTPYRLVRLLAGKRVAATAVAFLAVLVLGDIAIRVYVDRLVRRPDFVLNSFRASTIDALIEYKASLGKPLLVVIADSTLARYRSIPVREELQDAAGGSATVLVLGAPGTRPADFYFLMRSLDGHDVAGLFFTINYETFSPAQLEAHFRLRGLRVLGEPTATDRAVLDRFESESERTEGRISWWIERGWAAYRHRDLLTDILYGQKPADAVKGWYYRIAQLARGIDVAEVVDPHWDEVYSTEDAMKPFRIMYSFDGIDGGAANVAVFRTFCDELAARDYDTVAYLSPINWKMVAKWDLMEEAWFEENRDFLLSIPRGAGLAVRDFSRLVDQEHFVDTHHMRREGSRRLGEALAGVARQRGWVPDRGRDADGR